VDSVELKWVFGWEKKHFKDKKNEDLWKRFLKIYRKHQVKFVWVKGHASNKENNRCDELAVEAAMGKDLQIDHWYEEEHKKDKGKLL
jgi:ribonuclease HI